MKVATQSDAELLASARSGDEGAFTELYVRHHAAAHRLAQGYRRLGDPDDLVNGAFERVLAALRRGSGPTDSFRAYLFVTLRRLAMEQSRHADDQSLDEVPEPVAAVVGDPELAGTERDIIAQAFESLPGPWQTVLWQTAVEGKQPKDFAGTMGMTPNAAAALAYRARERLRQAYLQAHLQHGAPDSCEPHRARLGGYVRGGLSWRQERATRDHLAECEPCAALADELSDVNRMLVRTVAPIFLLASGGAGALTHLGTGSGIGSLSGLTGAASNAAADAGAGSPFAGGVVTGAADGGRRFGAIAGAVVAAATAVIALSVTLLPNDGGPAGGPRDIDVQTDAGPSTSEDEAARTTTTSAPPTTAVRAPTTTAAPSTATTTTEAPASTDAPPSSGTSGSPGSSSPSAGVEAGVGVDVGVGDVVQAEIDLGLSASWTPSALGGTLNVSVANRTQVSVADLRLDVSLGANANLSGLTTGCQTTPTGIVSGVISLLREVTCPLAALTGGTSTSSGFPVLLTLDSTATVTLSHAGEVVDSVTVNLT